METRRDPDARLFWKVTLVKALYERGYSKQNVLLLYRFIDCLVALPDEIAVRFHEEITNYEEEKRMTYITTAERIGIQKGIQQGRLEGIQQGRLEGLRQGLLKAIEFGLEIKFGSEGLRLYPQIRKIEDVDVLEAISAGLKTVDNLKDLRRIYEPSQVIQ